MSTLIHNKDGNLRLINCDLDQIFLDESGEAFITFYDLNRNENMTLPLDEVHVNYIYMIEGYTNVR